MTALTAREVAQLVSGELRGDPESVVDGVAPLDVAGPRHLSFLASARYAPALAESAAGIVLVARDLADTPASAPATVLVDRPHEAVQIVLPYLYDLAPPSPGIAATARIGRGVTLGERVRIDDYVVLGDGVHVGDDTHLHPHVTLYSGARLGARCIIHSGVRLATDGFGYVFRDGAHVKVPHVGGCVIGDDVEIGANTTVDRGSIGDTVIGDGTKIDNHVHIGHNVRIGRACVIVAQAGISGSTRIGDGVIIGGQAGIGGHLSIGDRARIAGQSGVFGDVPAGATWSGYPARPHRESLRASAALLKLSGMVQRLERLLDEKSS